MVDHRRRSTYRGRRSGSPGGGSSRRVRVRSRSPSPGSSGPDSDYDENGLDDGNSGCPVLDPKAQRSAFKSINPEVTDHLTPEHYILMPRRMNGFGLAQKERSNPLPN